jgi:hypothetical protein
MPDPRYATAREDGTTPYVVTVNDCGRFVERLVYVERRGAASHAALGHGIYVKDLRAVRRASPEDVTNLKEYR